MAIPVTGTFQPSGDFKIADLADLDATPDRLFYVDSSGDIQEITLGTDGQVLTSAGAAVAPLFEAIPAVKLDDAATPDDNTDLDASTSKHGLLLKLGGGTTNFLRADGTWNAPAGGGGDNHAPVGGYFPGVLSTGIKTTPQVPYKGDGFTMASFYIRVAVAPAGASITVQLRRNGSNLGSVATITSGNKAGSVAISQVISDEDYFDIDITARGSSPNFGSDLVWMVVP